MSIDDSTARAREIAAMRWTKPMRRALLRKNWVPAGHSGGEVLLAQQMESLGLFERVAHREYVRTPLANAVAALLAEKPR